MVNQKQIKFQNRLKNELSKINGDYLGPFLDIIYYALKKELHFCATNMDSDSDSDSQSDNGGIYPEFDTKRVLYERVLQMVSIEIVEYVTNVFNQYKFDLDEQVRAEIRIPAANQLSTGGHFHTTLLLMEDPKYTANYSK
eukprot:NODE_946_length_2957_cov_0.391882.p4 type:complete len:140 gc:universal NODE_946_length_2957_cov_0.391882:523-942(+)